MPGNFIPTAPSRSRNLSSNSRARTKKQKGVSTFSGLPECRRRSGKSKQRTAACPSPATARPQSSSAGLHLIKMKLLSILVIPALLAAQDQAKTRTGPAWIAWKNGTRDYAEIVRVTDSFVAIRQHQTRTCENVEWSRVADIKHLESTDISVLAALVSILFTFPMLPYWGI